MSSLDSCCGSRQRYENIRSDISGGRYASGLWRRGDDIPSRRAAMAEMEKKGMGCGKELVWEYLLIRLTVRTD